MFALPEPVRVNDEVERTFVLATDAEPEVSAVVPLYQIVGAAPEVGETKGYQFVPDLI